MSEWEPMGYKVGQLIRHEGVWWVACYPGKDGLVHGEPGKSRVWEEF